MGEEGGYISITTLSPRELLLHYVGQRLEPFFIIVRDKVTRQCPQTTTLEEKREPKRIRTEVPPLTSLTPYRYAKPAHKGVMEVSDVLLNGLA